MVGQASYLLSVVPVASACPGIVSLSRYLPGRGPGMLPSDAYSFVCSVVVHLRRFLGRYISFGV